MKVPLNNRQFVKIILIVIGLFTVFNLLTWELFLKDILTRENGVITGDLARLSYMSEIAQPRVNTYTLKKGHLPITQYQWQPVDMVVIGDSFSRGSGGGKNPYYQDYIVDKIGISVLNVPPDYPDKGNWLNLIISYHKTGFLKKTGARYLLIETTQRNVFKRFAVPYGEGIPGITLDNIINHYRLANNTPDISLSGQVDLTKKNTTVDKSLLLPSVSFINNGNFKYWWYKLMYQFDSCAFNAKVCKEELNQPLFSGDYSNTLLYYHDDLKSVSKSTEKNLDLINDNLNRLAAELKEDGIELIFMPVVSKYNLYYPYLKNKNLPEDTYFKIWSTLSRDYKFINTDELFKAATANGTKDIFFVDDTHWNYVGAEIVTDALINGLD